MSWEPSRARRRGGAEGSWLQTVTQVAALLAGLATVVYATGAVVFSLRLEFEHLPWTNGVSQLPREFVLSVGAGQVLLPALLVGALYGLYRVLRPRLFRILRRDLPQSPTAHGLRDRGRLAACVVYLVALVALFVPVAAVFVLRPHFEPHLGRTYGLLAVLVVAVLDVAAVQEIRAAVIKTPWKMGQWNGFRAAATMAGIYSAAAIPAMVAAAATVPFTEAKVCTTDNRAVEGVLVGEASDRVYIGERGQTPRRIVVLPFSKVGTMFVGERAAGEPCAFSPGPTPRASARGGP